MVVQQWLDLICQMLPRAKRGIVICDFDPESASTPVACWPERAIESADLTAAAALAAGRDAPVVSSQSAAPGSDQVADLVTAFPLRVDGQLFGVVAIQLETGPEHQSIVNQLLEWGQAWLGLLLRTQGGSVPDSTVAQRVITAGFEHGEIPAAAAAVATILRDEFSCQQVSLGLAEGDGIRVQGLSDHAKFDPRVNSIRTVECAMREVIEQRVGLRFPGHEGQAGGECEALALLTQATKSNYVCAVPMRDRDEIIGVILLQRVAGHAFTEEELRRCEELACLSGPQFALKRQQQRSLLAELVERGLEPLRRLLRPGYFGLKLICGALALGVFILVFVDGEYRVSAPAGLEGKIQRAIVAPFDGYVARAHARAGETVAAGDVIAELEDRELKLELRRWLSQRDEVSKQYRKALSELDHSQARIFRAQVAQAQAQLELIDQQLGRSQLLAPIDGIIISGDLSRSLGAPVERGEVLFEVAPLAEYRVVLQVNESEIRDVRQGQQGWLSLTALSNQKIRFEVERVATVFQQQDGKVSYRTEARIIDAIDSLRPGMQGVGKIAIDRRSFGDILFHNVVDWLRIRLWSWLP